MPAVNAPNINTWDGEMPERPIYGEGFVPDPGTGSLYNTHTPMHDDFTLYTDVAATPAQAPFIVTLPTLVDQHDHPLGIHGAAANAIPMLV